LTLIAAGDRLHRLRRVWERIPLHAGRAVSERWDKATWVEFYLTFNANGGTVSPASAQTDADGKLSAPPTPTYSGSYRFDGWYTAATVFTENATIYARWSSTGGNSGASPSATPPASSSVAG
jgi:hypothetical protein